jgi:hypothetical protein
MYEKQLEQQDIRRICNLKFCEQRNAVALSRLVLYCQRLCDQIAGARLFYSFQVNQLGPLRARRLSLLFARTKERPKKES